MDPTSNKARLYAAGLDPDELFLPGDPRLCPITLELMEDPVILGEYSFELEAIRGIASECHSKNIWTFSHPITCKPFLLTSDPIEEQFQRNRALKDSIDQYVQRKIFKHEIKKDKENIYLSPQWQGIRDVLRFLSSVK